MRKELRSIHKDNMPYGGTNYSAGFEGAKKLFDDAAANHPPSSTNKDCNYNNEKVVMLFLCDGRP
eukprot:6379562-Ditylum_brightwellii.AAC.1